MTAVIDKGVRIAHLGYIQAYEYHTQTKQLTIVTKHTTKIVDTTKHKVTLREGNTIIDVFKG